MNAHAERGDTAQAVPATLFGETAANDTKTIRVRADRLDALINLLGDLVAASAGASLSAKQSRQPALIEDQRRISQLTEHIRNGALQLRRVPIGETFARFRRVVGDIAAECGKDVQLVIDGGDTELDKAVLDGLAEPLLHLVRNALDHGLETAAQRMAVGKAAVGRLTLAARQESGQALIRIADDGRGILLDQVLDQAWARGLIEPGTVPPDDAILDLVFEADFASGMAAVRRRVEALHGTVRLSSRAGQGTCIEVCLPGLRGTSGSPTLGDGEVALILGAAALHHVAAESPAMQRRTAASPQGNLT